MVLPLRIVAVAGLFAAAVLPVCAETGQSDYYWRSTPVGDTAQILTLFCRPAVGSAEAGTDIPLVAVLRDTLGDDDPTNDRLTYVWLLTYERPNIGQRFLSAMPFFYWRVGDGPDAEKQRDTKPLLDLSEPGHPITSDIERDLLQWTLLDPSTTPIRATSRAYRTNNIDHERLHLEEAVSYLRLAPVSNEADGLTRAQIDFVTARLELRKKLLGGFVNEEHAARLGEDANYEQDRIRERNWELLREAAERTGLLFEPLTVGGTAGQYAVLWFPLEESSEPMGTCLSPAWKLLNIKNPWNDQRLEDWHGPVFERRLDKYGSLLPNGATQGRPVKLAPLSVYSLNYPKLPLLMVDFRDKLHVRWHEMTQRSINEIAAGVIGVSHFTNWYYFVAADLYDFIAGRHGAAVDQSARLDCYSQFRVELALDNRLNPALRKEMQERINTLEINPLESNPKQEIQAAQARYEQLEKEAAPDGPLGGHLEKSRREELASLGEGKWEIARNDMLHTLTLGGYTRRAKRDTGELAMLDRYRRVEYQLNLLNSMASSGTAPEVAYDSARIQASVAELRQLMPEVTSPEVRTRATIALQKLSGVSEDATLRADCADAVKSIENNPPLVRPGAPHGIAAAAGGAFEVRDRLK